MVLVYETCALGHTLKAGTRISCLQIHLNF